MGNSMTGSSAAAPPVLYDWSTDPELVELLLDPYRAGAEALAGAARYVVEVMAQTEDGSVDDGCPTCVVVARCRQAVAGWELLVGSEER